MSNEEHPAEQILKIRAQLAALTELLKQTPAGDGGFILSPARYQEFEKFFEYHLKKLHDDPHSLG